MEGYFIVFTVPAHTQGEGRIQGQRSRWRKPWGPSENFTYHNWHVLVLYVSFIATWLF